MKIQNFKLIIIFTLILYNNITYSKFNSVSVGNNGLMSVGDHINLTFIDENGKQVEPNLISLDLNKIKDNQEIDFIVPKISHSLTIHQDQYYGYNFKLNNENIKLIIVHVEKQHKGRLTTKESSKKEYVLKVYRQLPNEKYWIELGTINTDKEVKENEKINLEINNKGIITSKDINLQPIDITKYFK